MIANFNTGRFQLVSSSHGKNRVRIMRVRRARSGRHDVMELSVRVTVLSNADAAFTDGDNSAVVPTDTIKNTINVVAKTSKAVTVDDFAIDVAKMFLTKYDVIHQIRVEIESSPWKRAEVDGKPHSHGFLCQGPENDFVDLVAKKPGFALTMSSGIKNLVVLKTTKSGFEKFHTCNHTTLPEVSDRLLASSITARWSCQGDKKNIDYASVRNSVRKSLTDTFFGDVNTGVYSPSVQKTMHEMGEHVLKTVKEVERISLEMPNIHYIPMDLSKLGYKFENDVYLPTDEPHGIIEMSLSRNSAVRSRL